MNRIHVVLTLLAIFIIASNISYSEGKGFGLGIIIGEPTGISMKGWLSSTTAVDAGLAWSFAGETALHLHADYLLHSFDVFETSETIPLYYGIGARIKLGDHDNNLFGVRMVVGISYIFKNAPVDLFMEVAPILDLTPETKLRANAGLGARFYFR
jgi:hypothetical protein